MSCGEIWDVFRVLVWKADLLLHLIPTRSFWMRGPDLWMSSVPLHATFCPVPAWWELFVRVHAVHWRDSGWCCCTVVTCLNCSRAQILPACPLLIFQDTLICRTNTKKNKYRWLPAWTKSRKYQNASGLRGSVTKSLWEFGTKSQRDRVFWESATESFRN